LKTGKRGKEERKEKRKGRKRGKEEKSFWLWFECQKMIRDGSTIIFLL